MKARKVAIIAEWLTSRGGAEEVVYELSKIFPEADIFTTVYNAEKHIELNDKKVTASFLKRIPIINKRHQFALPLLPKAISSLDLRGYDLIISSSSAFGKGIKKPSGAKHICYCHTPMRYVWEPELDTRLVKLPFGKQVISILKKWDLKTNESVDVFIANSQNTARKIKKFYNRDSTVVYPPVDTEQIMGAPDEQKEDFYFAISRLVPYKRIDLAIRACKILGKKLFVAGSGGELNNLKKIAGENTKFLGRVENAKKIELYKKARATIFCAEEDFGIVPVESLAAGTPVIGYKKGGILEVINDDSLGVLFEEQTPESVAQAICDIEKRRFDTKKLEESSKRFSKNKFEESLKKIINQL